MEDLLQITLTKEPNVLLLIENLNNLLQTNIKNVHLVATELIDANILDEIKNVVTFRIADVYFGKTLQDLKIVIEDDELRKHELCLKYQAPNKLAISAVKLPYSKMQKREYRCVKDVIDDFKQNVNDLSRYFYELENMDNLCTIMEPLSGSFKDDFRRILLDNRTLLHVEVTPEGLATNIHLVGQSEYWHNKLQSGLLNWNHDKNIVDNIRTIFDLNQFPQPAVKMNMQSILTQDNSENTVVCGICLCTDLPDTPGLPLPLCQNPVCGVYYHRNCLYQWLVACAGSRPPALGVADGACPTCFQPVACSEKDN